MYHSKANAGPEWCSVERVVQRQTGVQLILDTKQFERRVHGDEAWDDEVVQQLQQHVQQALSELHLVGERGNGGWQVGRGSRIGIELTQSGGNKQDERHVKVVNENATAWVKCLDYHYVVWRSLQSVNSIATISHYHTLS